MQERGLILIVARNNLHLTKGAVRTALAQDMPCDVLLIDNASTDGTAQWAATKAIGHRTYATQQPLAACWNDGIKAIKYLQHEHVLILNNDVEIRRDTYRLLLAHGGPFVTCVSVRTKEEMRLDDLPTSESPHPDFSCFLIRKEVVDKVGYFDESYFPCWHEDNDYHVRMHRAGIEAKCIDLPFLHHGASTVKSANPADKYAAELGFKKGAERFRDKYGCYPGTPEYEALFT